MGCNLNDAVESIEKEKKNSQALGKRKKKDGIYCNKKDYILINTSGFGKNYTLGQRIGNGQYGEIISSIHIPTKQSRVIKLIRKETVLNNPQLKNDLYREFTSLKKMDHPNIIKIYEAYEDLSNLYISIEFLKGGTLLEKLNQSKTPLIEEEAKSIIKQILSAIAHCHSHKYAHRDIKLDNIMFVNRNENSQIKIIDFGFATKIHSGHFFHEIMGSPLYMSPQMLSNQKYNEKCDIWSLGITLYYILTCHFPYKSINLNELREEVKSSYFSINSLNYIQNISNQCKKCILRMLTYEEKLRPSALELLKDPWFIENTNSTLLTDSEKSHLFSNITQIKSLNFLQFASILYIILNVEFQDSAEKLGQIFKKWNISGEGRMTKNEFMNGLNSLTFIKINSNELNEVFSKLVTGKNQLIGYSDFLAASLDMDEVMNESNVRYVFGLLDVGNKGQISFTNAQNLLKSETPIKNSKIIEFWKSIGKDLNMQLTFEEFRSLIMIKNYEIFRF